MAYTFVIVWIAAAITMSAIIALGAYIETAIARRGKGRAGGDATSNVRAARILHMPSFSSIKRIVRSAVLSIVGRIDRAFWWVRYRTTDRLHVIDCRSPVNNYDYGYIDPPERILCGCLNVVKEFYEQEADCVAWDYDEQHAAAKSTIDEAYSWWTRERPDLLHKIDSLYCSLPDRSIDEMLVKVEGTNLYRLVELTTDERNVHEKIREVESEIERRDDDVLMKVMSVRKFLWT